MRLFVAVDIDDATREQMQLARDRMQRVLDAARVPPRVTWVKPEVAHVTLRFIGEVTESRVGAIQAALDTVRLTPFDVTWQHVGVFGGWRQPRVIWVAPDGATQPLLAVASAVNAALNAILGPGDARPFKAHLTIGRIRDAGRGVDWRGAIDAAQFSPTVTRVRQVTLYQSRLSPQGPTYTALSTHG